MESLTLGNIGKDFRPAETEEMINALVENDQALYVNLEYSRKVFDDIVRSGQRFDNKALTDFIALQNSYKERQHALKNSRSLRTQNWVGDKISRFKNWLGLGGLGALPAIPLAVGGAVLVVAGIVAYHIFKPRYTKSTKDLVVSEDLKRALESVSPETAQKIKDDLEQQVDDAFAAGRTRGSLSTILSTGKYVLLGGAAIWAFITFFPLIKNSVDKTKTKLIEQ